MYKWLLLDLKTMINLFFFEAELHFPREEYVETCLPAEPA